MPRPTVAEIDLDAIRHNTGEIRRLVGPGVRVCPAVKADAYGHGAVRVSRTLAELGVDMLGVSSLEEASELRQAGITIPILILGCLLPEDVPGIVDLNITSMVCSAQFARTLQKEAERAGRRVAVHIKVDTGMGRIGVSPQETLDLVRAVSRLPDIEIAGIFTHFPCSDDPESAFTGEQMAQFSQVIRSLEAEGIRIPLRHAANSGAILNAPDSYLDMVRPGIMLYGLYDAAFRADVRLRPALTLKSRIIFLKEIRQGASVSYGRTFSAKRKTIVATIPLGYADGFSRLLSNRGQAIVRGRKVPVIGCVCMDQTMLDVTDVADVGLGDEVVLYGHQGSEEIRIEEVASLLGTISYEVVCSVGKRVPRVYAE